MKMQNRRLNSVIAEIARHCRVVIFLLLATGVVVGGTDWHVGHNIDAHSASSYGETSSLAAPAGDSAVVAPSPCPSHVSCHQQVFFSNGTDLALLLTQNSSRRHRLIDATVNGRSTSLDHPPPKA